MAPKKEIKNEEVKIETKEELRNFSVIIRETKLPKVIKKSEYNPEIHIAI